MKTLEIIFFIAYGISSTLIGIGIAKKFFDKPPKSIKTRKKDLPNCRCTDVTQCDTWCIAKENYSRYHG